jgi:putative peptide zinc metalloprotease protein
MSAIDLSEQTFSNAWYRVADLRCALRASVSARRQTFGKEVWMVLKEDINSEWFRVSPEAYQFLATLSLERTVSEAWHLTLERDHDFTLSQEEVVQLLGQLHLANMLTYDQFSNADSFFERFRTKDKRQKLALLAGFLSIKLPLFDPNRALNASLPLIRVMFGPLGLGLYGLLILAGAVTFTQNSNALFASTQGILAPDNLFLLYLGFAFAKVIHELGHAALCKHHGGDVHVLGVMLLIFTPIPYVDASASWGFRTRAERLSVAAAGVLFELAVASCALLIWANTAPSTLNALSYNIVFTASVSTLLFNSNPLLRFDGYHVLVDALDMPNLFNNSRAQLKYLGQRYLLLMRSATPAAQSPREAWILPIFGVLSLSYWVVLMIGIVTFVANQYLGLGILMAVLLVGMLFLLPVFKFIKFLVSDRALQGNRIRTIGLTALLIAMLAAPLTLVPLQQTVRVSGVVEAQQARRVFAQARGEIQVRPPPNGSWVQRGALLLELIDPELDFQVASNQARKQQLYSQLQESISINRANIDPLREQIAALETYLQRLAQQQAALQVRAPIDGYWTAATAPLHLGQALPRGTPLGVVTQPQAWRFIGVLPQVESYVFDTKIESASLKVEGQAAHTLAAVNPAIIPFDNGALPSRALGMAGGGDIAIDPADPQGLTAAEPFFRIEASVLNIGQEVHMMHGALATMRLTLPKLPLAQQLKLKVQQYLQRRFRL